MVVWYKWPAVLMDLLLYLSNVVHVETRNSTRPFDRQNICANRLLLSAAVASSYALIYEYDMSNTSLKKHSAAISDMKIYFNLEWASNYNSSDTSWRECLPWMKANVWNLHSSTGIFAVFHENIPLLSSIHTPHIHSYC